MSHGSLRQRAYEYIQSMVLSGELTPGQRISEQSLAEEIGISRTPVRSAIRQLESEGLLKQVPRFGTIVKKLERRDLAELYDMRIALEGFAAEVAAQRMTREDKQTLAVLCDEMDAFVEKILPEKRTDHPAAISRFVDADMRFHVLILRATGNRRLMKSVSDSRMLSQWRQFSRTQQDLKTLAGAWEQHRQVLAALDRGEGAAAREAMVHHIRFSKDVALQVFDRLQAEGDAAEIMSWASPEPDPAL